MGLVARALDPRGLEAFIRDRRSFAESRGDPAEPRYFLGVPTRTRRCVRQVERQRPRFKTVGKRSVSAGKAPTIAISRRRPTGRTRCLSTFALKAWTSGSAASRPSRLVCKQRRWSATVRVSGEWSSVCSNRSERHPSASSPLSRMGANSKWLPIKLDRLLSSPRKRGSRGRRTSCPHRVQPHVG